MISLREETISLAISKSWQMSVIKYIFDIQTFLSCNKKGIRLSLSLFKALKVKAVQAHQINHGMHDQGAVVS